MTYYEKWFRSLSELVVEHGLASPDEIRSGRPAPGAAKSEPRLKAADAAPALSRRGAYLREVASPPAFQPGDRVRTRNIHPTGHTRLPRYARARTGEVVRWHGAHVFPDANAHGLGEQPRHLYTVRFAARELWGEAANPRDSVCLDLWEAYLERG
jgi:nitrile hydratase